MVISESSSLNRTKWVPLFLGCLFIVSAAFKTEQIVVDTQFATGIFSSKLFVAVLIQCELLLGIWLLSGFYPRLCRLVAIGVFCLFSSIVLFKGWNGESTCGCFGRLQINPWWTFVADLAALTALTRWRPDAHSGNLITRSCNRLAFSSMAVLLACGASLTAIANSNPLSLAEQGMTLSTGQLVVLEPEDWLGKTLPILNHIDIGNQLKNGKWILVLYHFDCPKCQEALPQYQDLAFDLSCRSNVKRVALVEVPPFGDSRLSINHTSLGLSGRLAEQYDWFVQAPVEISLESGIVISSSRELPSIAVVPHAESFATPVSSRLAVEGR